ncbi:hypothetical protein AUK22_00535 [bacterium CG2_30_54_10]|nr:MAG: hypothetical protein AUK22_00535 [bacterium CG2_30_54_10]
MYCFESFRCDREDCPVRRGRTRRCWTYFEELGITVTTEECPFAPCSRCHYRLGWEIGLIGDSLFPEDQSTPADTLTPISSPLEKESSSARVFNPLPEFSPGPGIPPPPATPIPKASPEPTSPASAPALPSPTPAPATPALPTPAPATPAPETPAPATFPEPLPITPQPAPTPTPIIGIHDLSFDSEAVGAKGLRFCWEVLPCPNPKCPVRERQIIRCFKFFEPKGDAKKLEITHGTRLCRNCHYKLGWDFGIIHEGLFVDITEKRRIRRNIDERIKRQGIVELYLNELAKKPLSREEELSLAKKIAGDKDAAELFLLANLKLVVRIAGTFSNRGLNIMDLIQEGNVGLIKAISKFDWTLGYRFSTYAAYWVKNYMQMAISDQVRTIRVPHHLLAVAHKIRRAINDLQAQYFRAPTLKELSAILMLEEEKILDVLRLTETPISIEAKQNNEDDEDASPEYFLTDNTSLSPEEKALENAKSEACQKALAMLPDRLREVAESYYGFRDEQLSLAEIGRRMGISRERARQLLVQALEELRHHEFVANMKDFLTP